MQYLAQADIKVSTRARYRFLLERHILPHLGHISVSRLTAKELSAFLLHMRSAGRLDGKGGLSAKTVRDIAVLIKTMLRYAQREYHCSCDALTAHLPACTQNRLKCFPKLSWLCLEKPFRRQIALAQRLCSHCMPACAWARSVRFAPGTLMRSPVRFLSTVPFSGSR